MLLGDQRKKMVLRKFTMVAAIAFIPTIFVMISLLIFSNKYLIVALVVLQALLATGFALYLISVMRQEKIALKGKKVSIISLDHQLNLEVDKKGTKQEFFPKEFYKDEIKDRGLLPVLKVVDENEVYEIVAVASYYYTVIENQFGQRYLVHTNNLKIVE